MGHIKGLIKKIVKQIKVNSVSDLADIQLTSPHINFVYTLYLLKPLAEPLNILKAFFQISNTCKHHLLKHCNPYILFRGQI